MFPYHTDALVVPVQIHLNVADLSTLKLFYTQILGLIVHSETTSTIVLGSEIQPFLVLHHTPQWSKVSPNESQLYHFAILVNQQFQLAHILQRLVALNYPLDGASDHQISHALYLRDPEGNGIEIAYDCDKNLWPFTKDGLLNGHMMINPLDTECYLNLKVENQVVWHHEAILGHVHFRAHDLHATHTYMTQTLHYDLTMDLNRQALFYSVGGYHHHFGFNRWGTYTLPLGSEKLGFRKLVLTANERLHSKLLIDPNGFHFEINKK